MSYLKLTDIELKGKRILIRADMNVPLQEGIISDDTRIRASLSSIQYCLAQGAAQIIVMTHLGRPLVDSPKKKDSVLPIANRLSELLSRQVYFVQNWQANEKALSERIVMLENVRLNKGEKQNDPNLGRRYAALCDVFVNDAFGTAHRSEASTDAVTKFVPIACAGCLLHQEIETLNLALSSPKRPFLAIVGGAKISTKLSILNSLANKVDQLIVGGGIANTFLMAAGYHVGASLVEVSCVKDAKNIMDKIKERGGSIPLPIDVRVAKNLSQETVATLKNITELSYDDMIFDIGPKSIEKLESIIRQVKTIVWNGPIGVFEFDQFSDGTRLLAQSIAASSAFSITGGGETIAAVKKFGVADKISYLSTGGGAFLEFLQGKSLPAIIALMN